MYQDVVSGDGLISEANHPEDHHLFKNLFNIVDGPCYVFVVHGRGPAVGGQGESFKDNDDSVTLSNVVTKDNSINDIKCWVSKVPALFGKCGDHSNVVNDARGAIFQTVKTFDSVNPYLAMDTNGVYNGNVVSDMQIMVAQAILDGTLADTPNRQIGPNSINQGIIDWAQDGSTLEPRYVCNGDSMHHVSKGIIVIRVEDTAGFSIVDNSINNVENLSIKPFSDCDDYHIGASSENLKESQAGNVRAISVAAVRGFDNGSSYSQIEKNEILGIYSFNANVIIGIDVQGDSTGIDIVKNIVNLQNMDDPNLKAKGVNLFQDTCDKCIAVRVREAVGGSISLSDNILSQEVQILNSNGVRGRARDLRKLPGHASGDIEWKLGGCPFASDYAKK